MIPMLAIAGSLARKKYTPPGAGTLPTHTPLFVVMVVSTVLLVGALTFVPALALGPIVEHLQMIGAVNRTYHDAIDRITNKTCQPTPKHVRCSIRRLCGGRSSTRS